MFVRVLGEGEKGGIVREKLQTLTTERRSINWLSSSLTCTIYHNHNASVQPIASLASSFSLSWIDSYINSWLFCLIHLLSLGPNFFHRPLLVLLALSIHLFPVLKGLRFSSCITPWMHNRNGVKVTFLSPLECMTVPPNNDGIILQRLTI